MRALCVTILAASALVRLAAGDDASKSVVLAPQEVMRLADAYLSSLPQQESAAQKNELRDEFVRMYLVGFVYARGSVSGAQSAGTAGLEAGIQYRRSHPDKLRHTFEGFGYTVTNAQGTWTVYSEHSGFRPDGHSGREWWLTPLSAEAVSSKDQAVTHEGERVRISGFLSPKGQYGHLGAYEHEFFATSISPIRTSQPPGAASRGEPVGSETNRTSAKAGPGG